MNPKVKMRAEMEEKFRRKYEEKAKELEAEFQRKFEEVKKDFAKQVTELHLDYQRMSKIGRQMSEDAAPSFDLVHCKECFANGCCSIQIDIGMGEEGFCAKGKTVTKCHAIEK